MTAWQVAGWLGCSALVWLGLATAAAVAMGRAIHLADQADAAGRLPDNVVPFPRRDAS